MIIEELLAGSGSAETIGRRNPRVAAVYTSAHGPSLCRLDTGNEGVRCTYLGRKALGAGQNRGDVTRQWLTENAALLLQGNRLAICTLTASINVFLGGSTS